MIGCLFTAAAGVLTFGLHQRLPYKRLLIITGVMLLFVLARLRRRGGQRDAARWAGSGPPQSTASTSPAGWAPGSRCSTTGRPSSASSSRSRSSSAPTSWPSTCASGARAGAACKPPSAPSFRPSSRRTPPCRALLSPACWGSGRPQPPSAPRCALAVAVVGVHAGDAGHGGPARTPVGWRTHPRGRSPKIPLSGPLRPRRRCRPASRTSDRHLDLSGRVRRRGVGAQALGDLLVGERHVDAARVHVDRDLVAVRAAPRSGRPVTASGAMCAAMKPCVAPEKRPSVISATDSPRPSPTIAAVTASISRIPGPPAGPSPRITTTSPSRDLLRQHRRHRRLLAVEHARGAGVAAALVAGELHHAPVRGHVAAQDREARPSASAGRRGGARPAGRASPARRRPPRRSYGR